MPNELGIFDSPGARARTASFLRTREQAVETLVPLAAEGLESAVQGADQTLTQLAAATRPSRRRVQEAFRERRPAFTPSPTAGLGPATTLALPTATPPIAAPPIATPPRREPVLEPEPPGLRDLAAGFARPTAGAPGPLSLQAGGEVAQQFFEQAGPEEFPFLRRIASGAGPTVSEMEQILESDLPEEQKRAFFESFRQSTLARQERAGPLGALDIPFHFAGLGAERGLEALGAPPGVQLGGNIAAQIGLGALGTRVIPTALTSRLPGGLRTALDVASVASTSEVRRPPRVPTGGGQVLFHGRTSPESAQRLMAEGFRPGEEVFLTTDPDLAVQFAGRRAARAGETAQPTVLAVEVPEGMQLGGQEAIRIASGPDAGRLRVTSQLSPEEAALTGEEFALRAEREAGVVPLRPAEAGAAAVPPGIPAQAVDDFEAIPGEAIAESARNRPMAMGGGGEQFTTPLRPFERVVGEVVTRDDPIAQALARTGVNPSLLEGTDVGRATVAFARQRGSAEQAINVAVASAVDAHRTGVGRTLPISIGDDAFATLPSGRRLPWNDLFSSKQFDSELNPAQRAFVDDYRRVVGEVEFLRVQAGLKPRAVRGEAAKEGWFYIPRQVEGIRGMELRRPSSPGLQRHYDEAIEGIKNGIKYESDPRAVLELHMRQAYKEIAEKQLSDFLEPLSITPKALIPEPVLQRMSDAVQRRLGAERNLRRLRAERLRAQTGGRFVGAEAKAQATLRAAKAPTRARLAVAIREAQAEANAAMAQYTTAKTRYSKALEAARKAELAPGNLFGKAEDVIPVAQWRNRFFPLEDAERLTEALGAFLQSPKRANWVGTGFEQLGNHIRFLSAVGDFAAPFIQGLPLLGRNPVAWSRATWRHYQAFADPTVQARFIREHIDTFQEMAAHNVPVGDVEFFKAIQEGQGISVGGLLERLPKGTQTRNLLRVAGRQTFGRFQASYDMFLTSARAQLWEAMKPGWRGSLDDLAAHVRNMTGGLDSKALGVGPTQRGFESTWLAFSPRLLRSTVALIGDLRLGLVNPRGRAAFQSLGGLVAGTVGIYIATGVAMGKSEEEIRTGLNPLEGKKFLSYNINNDWVGVGGQVRAITQLLTRAAVDPKSLTEPGQFDNPLLQFASSRGAPGLRIAQTIGEAATGADFLPFDDIDNLPDIFRHIGQSALPFAVQGLLEGEGATGFVSGLAGARTSPERAGEELARRFEEREGRPYNRETDRGIVETKYPDLAPLLFQSEGRQAVEAGLEGPVADFAPVAEQVRQNNPSAGPQFRSQYSDFKKIAFGATSAAYAGVEFRDPESEAGRLRQEFNELNPFSAQFFDEDAAQPDWTAFERERDRLIGEIDALAPGFKDAYEARLRLPPEFRDVETRFLGAQELRNQLGDIPQFRGISVEAKRNLDGFLRQIRDARDRAKSEVGPDGVLSMQDAIRQVGQNQGRSEAFITAALALNSTSARRRLLNPEYVKFVVDNADQLLYFYPELRSDVVSELLSRR